MIIASPCIVNYALGIGSIIGIEVKSIGVGGMAGCVPPSAAIGHRAASTVQIVVVVLSRKFVAIVSG